MMGPAIIFDKSAIQSFGNPALGEVGRYFLTLLPPVLLKEILADLSLKPEDLEDAKRKVKTLANKVFSTRSMFNADFRSMCIHNLLGEHVPMKRKPAVFGGQQVLMDNGKEGTFLAVQPADEAVLRWRSGEFTEEDIKFAREWRERAWETNVEEIKQGLPKPPMRLRSLEQVNKFVGIMLTDAEFQEPVLRWYLSFLRCDQQFYDRICFRWKIQVWPSLRSFAPYAIHCLRVQLFYYFGMLQGLLGTRPTNFIDLEYLYYTPFAFIFCSGDKLHKQLAPFFLQDDQSFVDREELRVECNELGTKRIDVPNIDPGEDSLIRKLWLKHWKTPPPPSIRPLRSDEENQRIMDEAKPFLDAIRKQDRKSGPRFPI